MLVVVCSFTPEERLNLGPLDRTLISWVLRLRVRSVTCLNFSFVVLEEWVLFVSTLFSWLEAVFLWSGGVYIGNLRPPLIGMRCFIRYYIFKVFPQFWLGKSTRIIHHNQLLDDQICNNFVFNEELTSKLNAARYRLRHRYREDLCTRLGCLGCEKKWRTFHSFQE